MTIQFRCEHCGHAIEAPETSAGQRSFCPKCGGALTIPLLTERSVEPTSSEPPVPGVEAPQYPPPLGNVEAPQYRVPGGEASESPFDSRPTGAAASLDPYQTPLTEPGAPFATSSAGSSNSMAVLALVFAMLSIAAIVMGIIGLQNSKKPGGSGRGLAITAIVIAAIAFVLYTALAVLGLALQMQQFPE